MVKYLTLIFILFANPAFAGSWSDVTSLLQQPTTLAQFVDRLPAEYFKYSGYTYVTESHSPERANTSDSSPRAILFGTDAKVILAFEGLGHSSAHERARAIRANDDGSFDFFEIEFGANPRLVPEANHRCARCHDGKPIWGTYREWSGTFGPQSDLQWVVRDVDGYFKYLSFLSSQKNSPLYTRLISGVRGDNTPVDAKDLIPSRPDFRPRNPYAPGAGYFLDALVAGQAKFVFSKFGASKVFEKHKTLIAAELLGCPLSSIIQDEIYRVLQNTFSADELTELQLTTDLFSKRAIKLELIGRAMGVSTNDWSMAFEPNRTNDVDHRVGFSLGSGVTIADYVFRELIRNISAARPDLQAVFSTPRWASPYYSYLNPTYHERIPDQYPKGFTAECAALQPYVEADFQKIAGRMQFVSDELRVAGATSLSVQCMSCHAGEMPTAPLIPFADRTQLLPWKQKLRARVSTGSMPMDRTLTQAQKASLLREIDQL